VSTPLSHNQPRAGHNERAPGNLRRSEPLPQKNIIGQNQENRPDRRDESRDGGRVLRKGGNLQKMAVDEHERISRGESGHNRQNESPVKNNGQKFVKIQQIS